MTDFSLTGPYTIRGDALLSEDRTLRRRLRRWWAPEPKIWASWLMLNPSIAGEHTDDPTLRRVMHFSQLWNSEGCIVVNLYPLISSDPERMWRWANWQKNGPDYHARDAMMANQRDIELAGQVATLRIVAFGAAPAAHDQPYLEQALEAYAQPGFHPAEFVCLGTTQGGDPLHPMARGKHRIPDDRLPVIWRRA